MVLDLVILYFGLAFVVAGWNIGARNSWPVPIAIIGATVVTQAFYLDLSALLVQELSMPANPAIFLGYGLLWILVEFLIEMFLLFCLPIRRIAPVNKWNKAGGAGIAFAKAAVVTVCASVATVCVQGIPSPPKYPLLSQWITQASLESTVLKNSRRIAVAVPGAVAMVISTEGASFQPSFEKRQTLNYDQKKASHYAKLFKQMKTLEEAMDSL